MGPGVTGTYDDEQPPRPEATSTGLGASSQPAARGSQPIAPGPAAALPARRQRLGLLTAAVATVVVGAWIGGDLVFRHGWRVHPAEVSEIVEEQSDDAATAAAFAAARREVAEFEREKTFLPPA